MMTEDGTAYINSLSGLVHAVLGFVALGSGAVALVARKRKGLHTIMGEVYHWSWLGLAVFGMWVGWMRPGISVFEVITIPSYLAALLAYVMGKYRTRLSADWLRWHIQGMSTSYLGVVTAFGIQTVLRQLPDSWAENPLVLVAFLVLPGVIGGQLIGRAFGRYLAKPTGRPRPLTDRSGSPA